MFPTQRACGRAWSHPRPVWSGPDRTRTPQTGPLTLEFVVLRFGREGPVGEELGEVDPRVLRLVQDVVPHGLHQPVHELHGGGPQHLYHLVPLVDVWLRVGGLRVMLLREVIRSYSYCCTMLHYAALCFQNILGLALGSGVMLIMEVFQTLIII